MKTLTLLRHAKSSWDNHRLVDHDRPLAPRGIRDAPRMGQRLAARGLKPDLILSSSAARALATTELIEPFLRHDGLTQQVDRDIYLASPGELLRVIADAPSEVCSLMLVGHNPGLTMLANSLLPDLRLANLPTAGVASFDCDTGSWRDIDSASFSLRFYDYPKNPEPV